MKKFNYTLIFILFLFTITIIGCKKKTECEKNGHTWIDATCENRQICAVCNETGKEALGHNWVEATITSPKTCSRCNKTEGSPLPNIINIDATISKEYISVNARANILIKNVYDLTLYNFEYDENVISINEFGQVTGVGIGITDIKITKKSNQYETTTLSIEVISPMPNIYTTLTKMTLTDVNNVYFKNLDELAEDELTDFKIEFTNNILELNSNNQLIAKDLGKEIVKITSKTDYRVTTSFTVEVVDDSKITVLNSGNEQGIIKVGDQLKLSINNFISEDFVWTTSDDDLAVVTDRGFVTAKQEGVVTIRIYDKNDISNDDKKCSYNLTISGTQEVDYVSNLIYTALREYGTKEGDNNDQKYGEWYGFNYNAWCAMFVSWSLYHSGQNSDVFIKYMSCRVGLRYAAENNMAHFMQDYSFDEKLSDGRQHFAKEKYTPKSGDIIMLFNVGHTGIVIYADDTYVYTVEGNSSNMVAVRRYALDSSSISAYISPNYPTCNNPEDFSWIKNPKKDGYYWWENCGDPNEIL